MDKLGFTISFKKPKKAEKIDFLIKISIMNILF